MSVAFPSTTSLDPTDVFSELGAYDPINWRLYARPFNGKDEYTEYGQGWTTMQRGKGYLLITREPKTIKIGGFDTDNEPQKISLESGWNLIGNPYLETLYWSDVEELNLLKNDITLNKLRLYNVNSFNALNSANALNNVRGKNGLEVNIGYLWRDSITFELGYHQASSDLYQAEIACRFYVQLWARRNK